MAVTVSAKNYILLNDCENYTEWNGADDDTIDFYKEGTQCVGVELWSSGDKDIYYDHPTASWDLSGTGVHIRLWWMTTVLNELNTDANGGMQIYLSDGANTGYWYVSGSTSYPGGWYNPVVDVSAAVDAGTKPTAMNAITRIGIRWNLTSSAKKVQSCWIDHVQVCDGLIAYGDDGGGYFDFVDILSADEDTTNGWGVIRQISGIYYLTGSLEFGDSVGTNGCKFQDKSQVIIFEDRPVNSDLYSFNIVDNSTGTTELILGAKSGTAGVQGCAVRVEDIAQIAKFDIDGSTDIDIDNFKLYGSTFYGADVISFPGAAATVEILNCSFEACGQVLPDDASISGCFFINTSDVDAALLWNESIDISNCSFIGNVTGAGIEMPSAVGTPYDYNALFFSGNTYDVLNSSGSAISISKSNSSDPTSYEGSAVTFTGAAITVLVHATDINGTDIQNARVFLKASNGTGPFPFEETVTISNSGTTATVTHASHGMQNNDYVNIDLSASGSEKTHYQNDGVFQITYIDVNSYSYIMLSAPGSSPTGTITATFVSLTGLTDVNGDKSTTRVYPSDQPVTGWARLTPQYKTAPLFGTVDDVNGYSSTGVMIDD